MWFGLLGAFTAVDDSGDELDLGPPQRRELLAVLLTNPNRPVSLDTIIDSLWPAGPPPKATTSIQSHISRLRNLVGQERIVSRSPGYLVRIAADAFDILDFLQSVEEGRRLVRGGSSRAALEELSRGLSLWRGEPLWDFAYSNWAQLEISRLKTARQSAMRELFRLALALGMHEQFLPDLSTASALTPDDEVLAQLHATALYRSGRQQDALEKLAALRRYLAEELGLDPSPQTDQVELAILRHDPSFAKASQGAVGRAPHGLSSQGLDEGGSLLFDELTEMELQAMTDPESEDGAVEGPLALLDRPRWAHRHTNLPAQLTSFVGRSEDIDNLEGLVRGQRLVTVTGPAGVGKTRLALQVAERLAGDFADGAWLVELATRDEPEQIPMAILEAMDVARGGAKAGEFLLEILEDRQMLLLVDNCEHMVDPVAALIESVLRRTAGVKVLCTSREPLGIPGEFLSPVAPLHVSDLPQPSPWVGVEERGDAVDLFVQRARSVSTLEVDADNASLVTRVCQQLEGLPLAIELAASQLDHIGLQELLVMVETQMSGLESPYRTIPTRQRTMGAAVDWSYRLLNPEEQAVFRRLGVFTGDFDRQAATAVCEFPPLSGDVASTLDRLVKRSLLTRQANGRYHLLYVLRHAAFVELRHADEEEAAAIALAHYYLERAAEGLTYTRGMQQAEWIELQNLDWPNIQAALFWGLQHDPTLGAAAVVGLTDYFRVDHGWEGIEWTNHYMEVVDDPKVILELHRARALSAMIPSVHSVVVESAEHILSHQDQADEEVIIDALSVLAMKAVETSDMGLMSEVRARMQAIGPDTPWARRRQANIEAFNCHLNGDLEGTANWLQLNLGLIPMTGEVWGKMGPSSNLAEALRRLGRLDQALTVIDDAVATGRDLGSRVMLSFSLITRAKVLHDIGRQKEALDSALEGLELAHQVSSRFETIAGAEVAAALLLEVGRIDDAAALHSVGHSRAEGWGQESFLEQYSPYHDDLVAGLGGLSPEDAGRATRRAAATPLPVVIDDIRRQVALST